MQPALQVLFVVLLLAANVAYGLVALGRSRRLVDQEVRRLGGQPLRVRYAYWSTGKRWWRPTWNVSYRDSAGQEQVALMRPVPATALDAAEDVWHITGPHATSHAEVIGRLGVRQRQGIPYPQPVPRAAAVEQGRRAMAWIAVALGAVFVFMLAFLLPRLLAPAGGGGSPLAVLLPFFLLAMGAVIATLLVRMTRVRRPSPRGSGGAVARPAPAIAPTPARTRAAAPARAAVARHPLDHRRAPRFPGLQLAGGLLAAAGALACLWAFLGGGWPALLAGVGLLLLGGVLVFAGS